MQREAEAGAAVLGVTVVLVPRIAHGLEALGEGECVAVIAAVRRAVAAGAGVPSCLGPLDTGPVGHDHPLSPPSYPQGTHRSKDMDRVRQASAPSLALDGGGQRLGEGLEAGQDGLEFIGHLGG